MVRVITKGFIALLVTTALLTDASYLFCMESLVHKNHALIENILNGENEHSKNPTNSDNHQNHHSNDPFHHLHHTSQITGNISVDSLLEIYGTFSSLIQDFPIEISTMYSSEKNALLLLHLQRKFRFRTTKEHINFLSVLLI